MPLRAVAHPRHDLVTLLASRGASRGRSVRACLRRGIALAAGTAAARTVAAAGGCWARTAAVPAARRLRLAGCTRRARRAAVGSRTCCRTCRWDSRSPRTGGTRRSRSSGRPSTRARLRFDCVSATRAGPAYRKSRASVYTGTTCAYVVAPASWSCFRAAALHVGRTSERFDWRCGGPQFVTGGASTVEPDHWTLGSGDAAQPRPLPFCSSIDADFCSDFDRVAAPGELDQVRRDRRVPGVENDDASVSPPNSFLATVPTFPAVDAGTAVAGSAILTKLPSPKGRRTSPSRCGSTSSASRSERRSPRRSSRPRIRRGPTTPSRSSSIRAPRGRRSRRRSSSSRPLRGGRRRARWTSSRGSSPDLGTWYQVVARLRDRHVGRGARPGLDHGHLGRHDDDEARAIMTVPLDAIGGARTLSVGVQATPPTGEAKIRFDNVTYSH